MKNKVPIFVIRTSPDTKNKIKNYLSQVLTQKETAEYLGITQMCLWIYVKNGIIRPVAKIGHSPVFYKLDIKILKKLIEIKKRTRRK